MLNVNEYQLKAHRFSDYPQPVMVDHDKKRGFNN